MGLLEQTLGKAVNLSGHVKPLDPAFGDVRCAVMGARELADDGGSGVSIVTEVGGNQNRSFKSVGMVKAPERRFKGFDAVARSLDLFS